MAVKTEIDRMGELWQIVKKIPSGRCASYGDVGRALKHPTSGRIVGFWMAQCPPDIPWWRVVAKNGALPIHKRDPRLGAEQRSLLEAEGIRLTEGRVPMMEVGWDPTE